MLKFSPINSSVDASFWQTLASKKLDLFRLSQDPINIHASYSPISLAALNQQGDSLSLPSHLSIPADGLDHTSSPGLIPGTLINTNTIEDFTNLNKNSLFQQVTDKISNAVTSKSALKNPNLLNSFLLLTFADLKKFKFYYWFAFPAIIPQDPWLSIHQHDWSPEHSASLDKAYKDWDQPSEYFFLINKQDESIKLLPLSSYSKHHHLFGFVDTSITKGSPGWPLRNLLYLIHTLWGLTKLNVVCYKPNGSYEIECSLPDTGYQPLKSVGWERNIQGKLGPRMADLGPLMDPVRLADTAIDLNLKLMRWRLLPELDLDKIKQTKCLLLGAGTLGCYVARCLMGWGVRQITFVDNGKVSFSNPVRQPLYQFQDTLNGGLYKAKAAADHLKTIQPTIQSEGHVLSIPMPGHDHYSTPGTLENDLDQLQGLIEKHDAIFLLTDSRESRWLPTLLGARCKKYVINSALGFDSYLVMRHGTRDNKIGCYFCNDIVAPVDSLRDRTLDQQCTVTRPGLAAIAGALAVELLVSLIQHPKGIHAPADNDSSILGLLPHQIRGFLGQFNNMLITGQSYDKCTACSEKVLNAYDKDPLRFLKSVLKDPMVLEDLTGLTTLKEESEAMLLNNDWADEEDDF